MNFLIFSKHHRYNSILLSESCEGQTLTSWTAFVGAKRQAYNRHWMAINQRVTKEFEKQNKRKIELKLRCVSYRKVMHNRMNRPVVCLDSRTYPKFHWFWMCLLLKKVESRRYLFVVGTRLTFPRAWEPFGVNYYSHHSTLGACSSSPLHHNDEISRLHDTWRTHS